MDIRDTEIHQRKIYAGISNDWLKELILRAVAEKASVPIETLRKHAQVDIEPNMEGSPAYQRGYKATVRAEIPLQQPEA